MEQAIYSRGQISLVDWEANDNGVSPVKSNRLDGNKTSKIVLVDSDYAGRMPQPGERWRCKTKRITNPNSKGGGVICVEPINQELAINFPDVWIPEDLKPLISLALQTPRKNVFFQGDQGCGKTTIAAAFALGFNWEFWKISGGAIKKYTYMLSRVMAGERNGQLSFKEVDSDLAAGIKEATRNLDKIHLLFVDEWTRIESNARDISLDVIEGTNPFLWLPNGDKLPIPPNIRWMAAGNVGSNFTIQRQDVANRSRWIIFPIDYMPADVEFNLMMKRYQHCPEKPLKRAIHIANVLRDRRFADGKDRISHGVSTREIDTVAMWLQGGVDLKVAVKYAIVPQYDGDVRDKASEAFKVSEAIDLELKNI